MRCLSNIDLSGKLQPISQEDISVTIVFNGENYDSFEVKPRLEAHDHGSKTHSDTETIVHPATRMRLLPLTNV